MLFWDRRINHWKNPGQIQKEAQERSKNQTWVPVAATPFSRTESTGTLPVTKVCLIEDSRLNACTEDGEVVTADWIGSRDPNSDKVNPKDTVRSITQGHFQACTATQMSPHIPDMFMTVGDWCFKIWKIGVKEPVFSSPMAESILTTGRWSPSRPGIIVTARADGTIDVWDLLDQGHRASLNHSTGSDPITSMEFWHSPNAALQYLAVGDSSGKLHVIEIPRNLRRSHPNEQQMMTNFYEREIQRVQYCDQRRDVRVSVV